VQVRAGADRWFGRVGVIPRICALLLVVAACGEQSNLDPDAAVRVSGVVEDVDGTPLSGRPVRLGSGVSVSEGGMAFLSVGLFCLSGECSGDSFDTTTSDDGSFAFDMTGRDAQSAFGEVVSFLLSTSAAPAGDRPVGPALAARFDIQTAALELPTMRLVDPEPSLSSSGGRVVAQWDGAVAPGPYVAGFSDRDGVPVWAVDAVEPEAAVDGRVLEDATGILTVSGTKEDAIEGSDLAINWRSSATGFRGGYGPPPSRGSGCGVLTVDGTVEPLDGCPLTDGSFDRAAIPPAGCPPPTGAGSTSTCPATVGVRIQLAEPLPADLVIVRGCDPACRISVVAPSADAPTQIGPAGGVFATIALDGSPITALDVITDDVSTLGEVSIWSPVRERQALLPVEGPVLSGTERRSDERSTAVIVAAALAVLLTGIGLGIVLGRRSRAQAM
jgi:hypothetical protein